MNLSIRQKNQYLSKAFNESWKKVINKSTFCLSTNNYKNNLLNDDSYVYEQSFLQKYLTEKRNTIEKKIEYSYYYILIPEKTNDSNQKDLFCGILNYIYYYSNNNFNTKELEFHFSGAKERETLELIQKAKNYTDDYDILSIFDYMNINRNFEIGIYKYAFFGITFKRIKVCPLSYSIRSGIINQNLKTHLVSFTFEGYDEENQKCDILDERININDLIPSGGFKMFYVRSSNNYYSSFNIKQIEPGNTGFWGFSISTFDIHGRIKMTASSFYVHEKLYKKNDIDEENDYNPIINMNDFLF